MKNRSRKFLTVLIVLDLLLLVSCGIYTEISISADKSANYKNYKTFAWLHDKYDTTNTPYNNEVIRDNLKNYFGQSFSEHGFRIKRDAPDLLLQIVVTNKKRQQQIIYSPHPEEYYYNTYYFRSRYYFPYTYEYYYQNADFYCYANGDCPETIQYMEGSITLNVIDRKLNKRIWSGSAKGDIYDPMYIKRDIHPAVKRIMKKFPMRELDNKPQTEQKAIATIKKN